jgi:hypothetical protein
MSTVQAFNTMIKNFMEELAEVFPEETQIRLFLDGFDALVALSPRGPLDMFVEALSPHADLAMAKDEALFQKLKFPGGIDFGKLWASDISDNTREAIWQYINLLFLLGTTVQSMPAEMLQSIETVAKNCADQMQDGQLDFSTLGNMLMTGGLANLAAGLGAPSVEGPGQAGQAGQAAAPRVPRKARQGPDGRRLARK